MVDAILVALVLLSLLAGAVRGFVRELLGLAGWPVAAWVAWRLTPVATPWLQGRLGTSAWAHPLGATLVFVLTLFAWGIASWLLGRLFRTAPLRPVDRSLGAVFGLVRGVLVVVVLAVVVNLTPWQRAPAWQASRVAALAANLAAPLLAWPRAPARLAAAAGLSLRSPVAH